ncbi:glucose PTS transporter subunit IIA [Mycoplasma corogypsi]|uniref:PTS transporter subunit IIABC n=1 Tax=Mycoplasma corogypsi TaxID=2106 RepID=UPI0038733F79
MFAFLDRFKKSSAPRSKNNSGSGKARKILSKLSGAFMLPISVMAIAGLFLGVGATIASNSSAEAAKQFGKFIQLLGEPAFAALPLLFAAAFVVAFTDEAGVGVFATIIAYLVFLAIQSVFITPVEQAGKVVGYDILFRGGGRNPEDLLRLVGSSLGTTSLQTSVFGGILVGLMVAYLYNRFHTIQLPTVISFFGGKRFVGLIAIPAAALLAILFLIFWPWIGIVLNLIGTNLGKFKYGDSFVFGYIERSLIPFGLHHVFYAPLWYTPAGGSVEEALVPWLKDNGINEVTLATMRTQGYTLPAFVDFIKADPNRFVGDSTITINLLGFPHSDVTWTAKGAKESLPVFDFVSDQLGIRVGRFLDGKFSFMILGLPGAAVAMILAAPKENRKVAIATVVPVAATSILTGVTEPIEFTFLFLSPFLFLGFHAFMAATSFLLANLLSVHIPMAFSGGFLDLAIYGMVNVQKGTNFWWTLVVGAVYFPIYLVVFYFYIKHFDLPTPGRGGNTKLFTKADYLAAKDAKKALEGQSDVNPKAYAIVQAYGGTKNITAYNNCASRLRYDVKDASLVNDDALKAAGAFGIKREGNSHVQAIFGTAAEQLNSLIKSQREAIAQLEAKQAGAQAASAEAPLKLTAIAKGELLSLAELNDGAFSTGAMGEGYAVKFSDKKHGVVYSPVDAKVTMVFPSKHAYGLKTEDGVEMLVHVGVDTVTLNGEGFTPAVKVGDEVKAGQVLAEVDLEVIAKNPKLLSHPILVVLSNSPRTKFEVTASSKQLTSPSDVVGEVK